MLVLNVVTVIAISTGNNVSGTGLQYGITSISSVGGSVGRDVIITGIVGRGHHSRNTTGSDIGVSL